MREVTVTNTYKVYTFDELSEKAKKKVISEEREFEAKTNLEELVDCMKSAMDTMGIRIKDYYIDIDGSGYIDLSADCDDLEGVRAYKFIVNNFFSGVDKKKLYYKDWGKCRKSHLDRKDWMDNCPFTGWCYDCAVKDAWDEWCAELKNGLEPSVRDFLDELETQYLKELSDGYDGFGEDEARDIAEANDYEFLEDGTIF